MMTDKITELISRVEASDPFPWAIERELANTVFYLREALRLALTKLIAYEPENSCLVSNDLIAMAKIEAGLATEADLAQVCASLAALRKESADAG